MTANELALKALNAALTHFGMDEDEWTKPTFDQMRSAVAALSSPAAPAQPAVEEALPMTLDSAAEDVRRTGYSATLHGVEFSVEEASSAGADVRQRLQEAIAQAESEPRLPIRHVVQLRTEDAKAIAAALAAPVPAVPAAGADEGKDAAHRLDFVLHKLRHNQDAIVSLVHDEDGFPLSDQRCIEAIDAARAGGETS